MANDTNWFDARPDRYAALREFVWDPIGAAAAALADPQPGQRVLDACCGDGASAVPLAERVGPAGHVDAVDLAPSLLAAGHERARPNHLIQVEFHCADVTTWRDPVALGYDHVVCVLGVYFLPDLEAGVRALLRDLRPGGTVTLTVWAVHALEPLTPALWQALRAERPAVMPEHRTPTAAEALADPDALRQFAARLGLRAERVPEAPRHPTVPPGAAWDLCTATAFAAALEGLDESGRRRVRHAVETAVAAGGGRLDTSTVSLRAVRPV